MEFDADGAVCLLMSLPTVEEVLDDHASEFSLEARRRAIQLVFFEAASRGCSDETMSGPHR